MWLVVQPCGCRGLRAALVPNGLSFCKKKNYVIYHNLFLCGKKKNFFASEVTVSKKKKKKKKKQKQKQQNQKKLFFI